MKPFLEKHFGKLWLLVVFGFLYLPLGFMVLFSFNSTRTDARFTGFSLRWYEALLNDSKIVDGFFLSLQIAAVTGVLSAVLATFAAFVLVRYRRFAGRTVFSGMVNAPLVMPEVIIGLSLLLLFVGAQNLLGWPQRGMLTIILGHTLLGMAYGMVVIQSRLLEMDRSIEEAARDLGARPHQVFFLVTLPNIFQAILAAFLLAFTLSFDDVVITEFLSGPGVSTLPQVIFGYARRGINPTIYAAATILIVTVTAVVVSYAVWVARATRRREREMAAAVRG
ncbi:MAG: putrescine ABC transporter permease PotI [Hydrogenophaga sp. SCN 70-13]|jgi:putrescine transport system permease protein|uniref:ABC transporter permease n=1 Tax=unclassified Hydrogenophaga TaxID=2610897 RepID=UPI00086EEFE7|nr:MULTISPECIES: ABC transporter permease subunit [unclassified Hydrogenophaga]MBN9370138.1 ABC transporter permease subunit [Hydrogenophaga sp.]ODT33590.1 MAG: putrescine ABC transporter permease PotI [Hydrogenophaga sp. SCN 70-13]OJV56532.1 MAG: putrescine ABC transporter permease PotI [Hydrogenophaga sp. 70-12]